MLRKAESAWSWVTSTWIGVLLLSRETAGPDAGVREASVRLTWKNRTDTPAGGSSVMVRDTGTVPVDEAEDGAEGELPEFVPHPLSNENIMAEKKRKNAAFRILDLLDVRD